MPSQGDNMPPNEDLRQSPLPIFNAGEMPGPWPQGKFRLFVVKFQPLNDSTEHSEHSSANTSHSAEYIKIVPHPHNIGAKTITIPLDATTPSQPPDPITVYTPQLTTKPWAPFRTRGDFEYTETAVQGLLPKHLVNRQLAGINKSWSEGSKLTIRTWADMERSLDAARQYSVQVGPHSDFILFW